MLSEALVYYSTSTAGLDPTHVLPILHSWSWLLIRHQVVFKTKILVWKCVHSIAPAYIKILHLCEGLPKSYMATVCIDTAPVSADLTGQQSFAFLGLEQSATHCPATSLAHNSVSLNALFTQWWTLSGASDCSRPLAYKLCWQRDRHFLFEKVLNVHGKLYSVILTSCYFWLCNQLHQQCWWRFNRRWFDNMALHLPSAYLAQLS